MRQHSIGLGDARHQIVVIATAAATGMLHDLKFLGKRCECKTHRRNIKSRGRILEDS